MVNSKGVAEIPKQTVVCDIRFWKAFDALKRLAEFLNQTFDLHELPRRQLPKCVTQLPNSILDDVFFSASLPRTPVVFLKPYLRRTEL